MANLNEACHCGSGEKYERCCGRPVANKQAHLGVVEMFPAEGGVIAKRRYRFCAEIAVDISDISQALIADRAQRSHDGGDLGTAFFQNHAGRQRRALHQMLANDRLLESVLVQTALEELQEHIYGWHRENYGAGSLETVEAELLPHVKSADDRQFWKMIAEDHVTPENIDMLAEVIRSSVISADMHRLAHE